MSRWDEGTLAQVRAASRALEGPGDLDDVVARCRDARVVLVGEASHGTAEHYQWRATLTQRLVEEEGFDFVAVEGDWPACMEVDRWVKDPADTRDVTEVLEAYRRWPTWMWANEEVARWLTWLKEENRDREASCRVGFYGIDVYSLWESLARVVTHVERHHKEHLDEVREAVECFQPYGEDPQEYAWATKLLPVTCEHAVSDVLTSVLHSGRDGTTEDHLDAEMNAHALRGAEEYYRKMVQSGPESWNVRDTHMVETLQRLLDHHGPHSRAVVWEHNTHVGDARATDMAGAGMVNVGQLARERWGEQVTVVGMGAHRGEVVAASEWGAPWERKIVPEAAAGSVEDLLHTALGRDSALVLQGAPWAETPLLHRAIGVVYHPMRERRGNYVPTILAKRYDCFLHFEETSAVRPLHRERRSDVELAETYPSGM